MHPMTDSGFELSMAQQQAAALPRDWPRPSDEALAHSARLLAHLRETIDTEGPLEFARFMELALYAPGLGYYSGGARKFGAAGDFVTAPELSPLFGACVARQCEQVLRLTGGEVLELGAGSGALAASVLETLERLGVLPDRYLILERSADLRQRQQAHLREHVPALCERVEWLDDLPGRFNGIVLANEVLDAQPVSLFVAPDRAPSVGWGDGGLEWREAPAPAWLQAEVAAIGAAVGGLEAGYTSEVSPQAAALVASLAERLESGLLLFIDYGMSRREYYHPQRSGGTLMCHYRHRAHADPLLLPGLQDITAYVDFTRMAGAGRAAGLVLAGYATQAHFLLGCGLDEVMGEIFATSEPGSRVQIEAARDAKLLTLPGEMGERFKVLGLSRGLSEPLRGFGVRDLSLSLDIEN